MVDGTTLKVDNLVRKIAIQWQSSHSTAVATVTLQMLILRGLNTLERKTEEPGQVSLFRNNAARIFTF